MIATRAAFQIFFVALAMSVAQAQHPILTNGLALYYPFDGSSRESLTSAPDPVLQNVTYGTDRKGSASAALALNGNNSSVYQPDALFNIGEVNYAISFWFKTSDTTQEYQGLINTVPHNGVFIVFNHPPAVGALSFRIGGGDGWISAHTLGAKSNYSSNQWYHVVLTKTGTDYAVYVNGELDSSVTVPSAESFDRRVGFRFGAIGDALTPTLQHLNGGLDEVKVFLRAMTAEEAKLLFNVESGVRRAKARLEIVNGFIVGVVVEDGGYGYTNAPNIIVRSTSGTGALLTPQIVNGSVSNFIVVNAGNGYDPSSTISIASPPFPPSVAIAVSRVKVIVTVVQGNRYVLESSHDLSIWNRVGEPFVAEEESISQEFLIADTGRYFRLQQLP